MPCGNNAPQVQIVIDDVNVINGFQVLRLVGEIGQGVSDGQILVQHGDFRRHHCAGRILRILPQLEQVSALVRRQEGEDFLNHFLADIVQKVHPVVRRQIGE